MTLSERKVGTVSTMPASSPLTIARVSASSAAATAASRRRSMRSPKLDGQRRIAGVEDAEVHATMTIQPDFRAGDAAGRRLPRQWDHHAQADSRDAYSRIASAQQLGVS
jgi:hypothetical protein